MRGFFGLTGEFAAVVQIEVGQGGARLERNVVTCGAMTSVESVSVRRGGVMGHDRETEGGGSAEPAFDVSRVCLRVRGLFGLTSEIVAVVQIERGQGGARLEHNDVTCGAMTAVGVFL